MRYPAVIFSSVTEKVCRAHFPPLKSSQMRQQYREPARREENAASLNVPCPSWGSLLWPLLHVTRNPGEDTASSLLSAFPASWWSTSTQRRRKTGWCIYTHVGRVYDLQRYSCLEEAFGSSEQFTRESALRSCLVYLGRDTHIRGTSDARQVLRFYRPPAQKQLWLVF